MATKSASEMSNPVGKSDGASASAAAAHADVSANPASADRAPQIAYTDLRQWIEEARKLGEVRSVKGLSWQRDIGAASEVILHDENAPCVIFEDIPGSLPGSKPPL